MYCKKCGELLSERAKFCTHCGAPVREEPRHDDSVLNPTHQRSDDCVHEGHVVGSSQSVGFMEAFILFFRRYSDFKGRSRRSEYWWANLACCIVSSVISIILPDLVWIWTLIIFVPSLSVCVRRLHDIGKSGWWYLINFVPLVGQIIFLVFMCKDSTEDNIWGFNPKA